MRVVLLVLVAVATWALVTPVPAFDAEFLAAVALAAVVRGAVVWATVVLAVLILGAVVLSAEVAEPEACPGLGLIPWLVDACGGLLGVLGLCARKGTMA